MSCWAALRGGCSAKLRWTELICPRRVMEFLLDVLIYFTHPRASRARCSPHVGAQRAAHQARTIESDTVQGGRVQQETTY